MYSPIALGRLGYNEEQIGKFFQSHPGAREKTFLATKFVNSWSPDGKLVQRGDHDYAIQACNDSLKRLGVNHIDLYYAHRAAPNADVTETVGAMKELKDAGKIRYIGVSEYNLDQLERANNVAHIDAVQVEMSPWTPEILSNGILEWCEKNGTALVAYSPLGRGFLTGQYKSLDDFEANDFRRHNPRFTGENFARNLQLVDQLRSIAENKKATAGQIALAWCLSKSPIIIPIPGTKNLKYLKENISSTELNLTKNEIDEIDSIINAFKVSGTRYAEAMSHALAF